MLDLAHLETLVHLAFQLLLESSHLVALLSHQVGLGGKDLLVDVHHVLLTLLLFKLLGATLRIVSLFVVLLFGHLFLNLAQVKQLSRLLILGREDSLQVLTVLFELLGVALFQSQDLVLVIGLSLLELVVPVLVKVLVLLDMGLFAFLALLLVHED